MADLATSPTPQMPPGYGLSGVELNATDVNVGNIDVASIAAGDNNIGNVDIASAIPAGTNNIGDVDVASIAAGDNNIGNVDVVTDPAYGTVACGEVAGATSATQMPSVACRLVRVKAHADNAGKVNLGGSGVTKVDGSTDTSTGLQLSAGDDTGWIPVTNLNLFYRICDNAGDDVTYLALT